MNRLNGLICCLVTMLVSSVAVAQVPANDLCADASVVAVPSSTGGSTLNATVDGGLDETCATITAPGVWYTVTGTGNSMTATTCSEFTAYDTKISVFCACDGLQCVAGNDDDPTCVVNGLFSTATWCSQAGQEYKILVHGFGSLTGGFLLGLSDNGIACSPSPQEQCIPLGACCFSDGSCLSLTATDCTSQGGTPLGDGTKCSDDSDGDGVPDCSDQCPGFNDNLDTDGDGTPDCLDNCVNTPNPDQLDTDGDGTGDACDGCLNDPNKVDPGICGCGVPDTGDSDGDGVLDCVDNCVNTPNPDQLDTDGDGAGDACDGCPTDPNKIDPGVCGCGTMDIDSDGDGVLDCNDQCPGIDDNEDLDGNGVPDCKGACCIADGSCQILSPSACLAVGGSFDGLNSTCTAAICDCVDSLDLTTVQIHLEHVLEGGPGSPGIFEPIINDGTYNYSTIQMIDSQLPLSGIFITLNSPTTPPFILANTINIDLSAFDYPQATFGKMATLDITGISRLVDSTPGTIQVLTFGAPVGAAISSTDHSIHVEWDKDVVLLAAGGNAPEVDIVWNSVIDDCDGDGVPDDCQIFSDPEGTDCNGNGIPDSCDIDPNGGSSSDCNQNGVPDECDISNGTSLDFNGNGIPDECECLADCQSTPDCVVDINDLIALMNDWNTVGPCDLVGPPAGINGPFTAPDGVINMHDLTFLINNLGACGMFTPPCSPNIVPNRLPAAPPRTPKEGTGLGGL